MRATQKVKRQFKNMLASVEIDGTLVRNALDDGDTQKAMQALWTQHERIQIYVKAIEEES